MLKLLKPFSSPRIYRVFQNAHTFQSSFSSSSSSSPSSNLKPREDVLYFKLLSVSNPSASVLPILNQWVTSGNPIDQFDIRRIIKQLRNFKRFKHALEICKWVQDMKVLDYTPGDMSVELDLISKLHGLKEAEKYFESIPESSRQICLYASLLNCYASSNSLEKAESIMNKLREMGYSKILSYNVMLSLYTRLEKYDKIKSLIQEMDIKHIERNEYTYNIMLNSYVSASDIERMEDLLTKMEINPDISIQWNAYIIAAQGYFKADQEEKALKLLKKAEGLIYGPKVNSGLPILLTIYANMGKKNQVYRIWKLLKKFGKFRNVNYVSMISSLEKVNDIEGAEKILEEWEMKKVYYDIKVPNMMITVYCKRGIMGKAEELINRLIESGIKVNLSTWTRMARGYFMNNEEEKGVECMKKAILLSVPGDIYYVPTLADCLKYLKRKGDNDGVKEFLGLLDTYGDSSKNLKEKIIEYIKNGIVGSEELSEGDNYEELIELLVSEVSKTLVV